jgi:hypothetical protein
MTPVWFIVATLSLVVLEASAANLEVGKCVTISSNRYPGRYLYDAGPNGNYWVYTTSRQSIQPTGTYHHWRVKSKQGSIYKFENVRYNNQCFCERQFVIFTTMYAGTCECKDGAKAQEWDLRGGPEVFRFKRPNTNHYDLEDCPSTSCAYIMDNKPSFWVVKNVNCETQIN